MSLEEQKSPCQTGTDFGSTWRPLIDAVEDWPLCFCDAGTVKPGDLVESDHVRKAYTGMTMYSLASDAYRWYYLNQQRRDEVTLIKIFDSHPNGPAVRTYNLVAFFGMQENYLRKINRKINLTY